MRIPCHRPQHNKTYIFITNNVYGINVYDL